MSTSCSLASEVTSSVSSGFIQRASATVTPTVKHSPSASTKQPSSTARAASTAGARRVPMLRMATLALTSPSGIDLTMRPLPIGSTSPSSGMASRPYPKRSLSFSRPSAEPRG